MAEYMGYGKPCMTNLPGELGRSIIRQILTAPKPDDKKLHEEAERIGKEIMKIRQQEEDAKRNISN